MIQHGASIHGAAYAAGLTSTPRHWASSNRSVNLPPMGMRVRLKASFNTSSFPPVVRVILAALKRYGMMVADNGSNWYITGGPIRGGATTTCMRCTT